MGYTNRVYRNKMGVGMTSLRSLPNCQHHPILTQDTTTLRPPPLHPRKTHLHLHSHPTRRNPLPSQEGGHLQQRALLVECDSQAWRACSHNCFCFPRMHLNHPFILRSILFNKDVLIRLGVNDVDGPEIAE